MNSVIDLGIITNFGEIYYTTYGTDPQEQFTSNITSSVQLYINEIKLTSDVTLKARAKSGNEWSLITESVFYFEGTTAIKDFGGIENIEPKNYPNPFSQSTEIYFTLPFDGEVQVDIFVPDGRILKNLYYGFCYQRYN